MCGVYSANLSLSHRRIQTSAYHNYSRVGRKINGKRILEANRKNVLSEDDATD